MQSTAIIAQRLLAIFLFGALLFNYPILSLFNLPEMIGGFPLLLFYIFSVWALVIALVAVAIRRGAD